MTAWRQVRARVDAACERAGRAPSEVTVVAVSKTHPAEAVRAAAAEGALDFGENYAQELDGKRAACADLGGLRWHFIGRLQRNKAKLVAGKVALVHAVDSVALAEELARRAEGRVQPILLAVNVAGEATKGGVAAEAAPELARAVAGIAGVRLDGLMTMPPPSDDPEASRPSFAALRELRARIADALGAPLPVLSMGMSGDFEVAIACGATHVRIGTAIFGARP
ncbi:MAG: YggS family pyridoxal phosphate-dependent enzyme [Deltaproteobacteria bacterium]|nr:YggS family pyridoxal phosphate-dependent enzyme [Deltaproteobacteria bacterium]MCW5803132.1 YggS family pyridoxal phosphate-dependent enzyme [Deltaproteobacteria bacterium]